MKKFQGVSISGVFERDQRAPDPVRCKMETMHACPVPGCEGGEIRYVREDSTSYRVRIDQCGLCEGTGVVAKHVYLEYMKVSA